MSNWNFAMTNSQFFLFQKLDSLTTRFTPEGVHTPCDDCRSPYPAMAFFLGVAVRKF